MSVGSETCKRREPESETKRFYSNKSVGVVVVLMSQHEVGQSVSRCCWIVGRMW